MLTAARMTTRVLIDKRFQTRTALGAVKTGRCGLFRDLLAPNRG
jgi:hypothetical protein